MNCPGSIYQRVPRYNSKTASRKYHKDIIQSALASIPLKILFCVQSTTNLQVFLWR